METEKPIAGPSRSKLPLIVAAVVVVLLLGGAATWTTLWWLGRGGPEPAVVRGSAPPIPPEPPPAPAAWKGELAPPQVQANAAPGDLAKSLEQAAGIVSALGPELQKLPLENAAPAALLVVPGESRTLDSVSRIPRHERWEIRFPPGNTIDSYSRQLDFFQIELGVIGDGNKVTYLANLSAPTPTTRSDGPEKDQRLYLVWQRGALREAAEELASRAKVDPRGKVLAHFCPPELEAQLAELEEKHAAEKGHRRIRRTIFGIEPSDAGGYRFVVVDQQADIQ